MLLLLLLLVVSHTVGYAGDTEKRNDILELSRGAVVLQHTGQGLENCPEGFCYPVIATLDGTVDEYWVSPVGRPFPQLWTIELDRTYRIDNGKNCNEN